MASTLAPCLALLPRAEPVWLPDLGVVRPGKKKKKAANKSPLNKRRF